MENQKRDIEMGDRGVGDMMVKEGGDGKFSAV